MKNILRPALILFFVLTLVTGVAYPLVVTGAAQSLFPVQAAGSLSVDNTVTASGNVLLQATGTGADLTLAVAVSSSGGALSLNAANTPQSR